MRRLSGVLRMEQGVATAVLCIVGGGVAAQVLAARLRIPAIVLLLGLGFLVGPALELLRPTEALGPNLRPLIGLAVAIVVFEGGLALDFRELRAAGGGVLRLTAIALPINFVLGTFAAHFIGGMLRGPSAVFGAILVVTGPTVILPLLRHARLERRSASFLKWEAIVNDPVGAILTAIGIEILVGLPHRSGEEAAADLALHLAEGAAAATVLGVGSAFLVAWAFRRDLVPETLKTPLLLALALVAYAVPNLLMHEAGLIGATIFGIALANLHVPGIAELRRFKEVLVVLLVSCLFVVLTADLDLAVLGKLSLPILALTAATLFLVRPAAIWLATWRSDLSWRERLFVGWIGRAASLRQRSPDWRVRGSARPATPAATRSSRRCSPLSSRRCWHTASRSRRCLVGSAFLSPPMRSASPSWAPRPGWANLP
ncbi:cation:proton antiporter [Methylorubrum extorquens]